jgi:hypothetical protein
MCRSGRTNDFLDGQKLRSFFAALKAPAEFLLKRDQ